MRKILGIFRESQEQQTETQESQEVASEKNEVEYDSSEKKDYITDNDLLSNPFFTTLTPID